MLCVLALLLMATQPYPALSTGNSLKVLRVLGDGHVDDVQGMLIVLLGREEQCQQMKGIGIILAHCQGPLQLFHGTGDLPKETASLGTFPRLQYQMSTKESPQGSGQVTPWHWDAGMVL